MEKNSLHFLADDSRPFPYTQNFYHVAFQNFIFKGGNCGFIASLPMSTFVSLQADPLSWPVKLHHTIFDEATFLWLAPFPLCQGVHISSLV